MAQFGASGFNIVGFPCPQFDNQEPGDNDEILNTLKYVRPGGGFVPAFPLVQIGDVNGATSQPIWTAIRSACPQPSPLFALSDFGYAPVTPNDIVWNFEKVLIDSKLRLVTRYSTLVAPSSIAPDIQRLVTA